MAGGRKRRSGVGSLRGWCIEICHALPGVPRQVAEDDPEGRLPSHEAKTVIIKIHHIIDTKKRFSVSVFLTSFLPFLQ